MLLEMTAVRKHLGGRWILTGADVVVPAGSLVALLGPNGSGKSTLLRIAAGVLTADLGEVTIAGHSLRRARVAALSGVGYAPEVVDLPPELTVAEFVELVAALKGAALPTEAERVRLGVDGYFGERIASLSLGMKRRAGLLAALVGAPRLLLLDEPTNGMDAGGLATLRALLTEHARGGGGALVATHDRTFLDGMECTALAMREGLVVAAG